MRAIVCTKYGPPDVLQLQEVEKPAPKDNEILIKIHAATVTMGDCEMRSLKFTGVLKFLMKLSVGRKGPKKKYSILGQELAGVVEQVGSEVKLFKIGDPVFGTPGFNFGCYSEYTCLHEKSVLLIKPDNLSFEEAATVPIGALEAVHYLRKVDIQKGQSMLIRGASGSIGTIAIQIAKYYGAEVIGVGNPRSLDIMKSIGADKVIDYTKEDFTENNETYDYIFDIIGRCPFSYFEGSLKKNGTYLLANPEMKLLNREKKDAKKKGFKYISGNVSSEKQMIEEFDNVN